MTTVRTYGNLAEAGFAKSLLEAAGISAELANESSYSVGYGAVVCELRLQVDEADLDRARHVLAEGPDAPSPPPAESSFVDQGPALPPEGSRFPAGIFVAILVGSLVLFFVSHFREKQQQQPDTTLKRFERDTNNDGKPDEFAVYRGENLVSSNYDRNRDGKPDRWFEYDARGTATRGTDDNNFDGRVDIWYEYESGDLKIERFDTDFNGVPDLIREIDDELPIRSVYKPNGSTFATRIGTYVHGNLVEELVDSDGDAKMDYRIKYDAFSNPSERLPIEPGK
jgi:Putative prokaryotic signal transducing protein